MTTPMPLSDASKAKVKKRLLDTTDYREFEMIYAVDESLIGGMVIRIGNKIIIRKDTLDKFLEMNEGKNLKNKFLLASRLKNLKILF